MIKDCRAFVNIGLRKQLDIFAKLIITHLIPAFLLKIGWCAKAPHTFAD